MPHPSSRIAEVEERMDEEKRKLEGEASQFAKRGVIFQRTVFVMKIC